MAHIFVQVKLSAFKESQSKKGVDQSRTRSSRVLLWTSTAKARSRCSNSRFGDCMQRTVSRAMKMLDHVGSRVDFTE